MLVKDRMTKKVIFVSPDASVTSVAEIMIEKRIHGIPVVKSGKPIGIITETDFFTKGSIRVYLPEYTELLKREVCSKNVSADHKEKLKALLSVKAKDVMSSPCVTIKEMADVAEFLSLVREKNLTSVPVVNDHEELVGIITMPDVIHLMSLESRKQNN